MNYRVTVSNEMLSALGRVVVFHSVLDHIVRSYLMVLLGAEPSRGEIVISELSFKGKLTSLGALIVGLVGEGHEHYKKFLEIRKRLYEFEQFRNKVAHSFWFTEEGGDPASAVMSKISARGRSGLVVKNEDVTINDIECALREAESTDEELSALFGDVYKVFNPFWDKM